MTEMYDFVDDPLWVKFQDRPISVKGKYKTESAMRCYLTFLRDVKGIDITPSELLQRAKEDREKDVVEGGEIEREWCVFVGWLANDYRKLTRQRGATDRKLSPSTVASYASGVKAFYSFYRMKLGMTAALPSQIRSFKGKVENDKYPIRPDTMKRLISALDSTRDRALALVMFTSGMDISTALSIKIRDVSKGMSRGDDPLMLKVIRPKAGIKYRTFITQDAINALQTYLNERELPRFKCSKCGRTWMKARNKCPPPCANDNILKLPGVLTPDDYLFAAKWGSGNRIAHDFQHSMRKAAILSGLITEAELEFADINPMRPHSLRAAFSSILSLAGMNQRLIDYMQGHTDPYGGAYYRVSDEEIRGQYAEHMHALLLDQTEGLAEVTDRVVQLETMNLGYEAQVGQLKKKLQAMEEEQRVSGELLKMILEKKELQ